MIGCGGLPLPAIPSWVNRRIAVYGTMLCSCVLLGCASGQATFKSQVDVGNMTPIERMVVMPAVRGPGFNWQMYEGFIAGLKSRLATCGVQSTFFSPGALELDADQQLAKLVAENRASAIMSIAHGPKNKLGTTENALQFELSIVDVASQKTVWMATGHLQMTKLAVDHSASGVQFATRVVSRLRADHVLKGCPPPEAGWSDVEVSHSPPPECLEERQRVLDAAANTTDLGKRAKMMQSAPTCE